MNRSFVVSNATALRSSSQPPYRQIAGQIGAEIRRGTLPARARLPSSRLLARSLRVSRNTIVDAYECLLDDGSIESRAGSGVRVRGTIAGGATPDLTRLRATMRAAHYPHRTIAIEDPDGNALYLNALR